MKKIIYYRTKSFGGQDGRERIERNFETEELARENALEDTWNDGFKLYKVIMTFDGIVTEEEEFMTKIPCLREKELEEYRKTLRK